MLNRNAIILVPKEPFIEWMRSVVDDIPFPESEHEPTVYLVPNALSREEFQEWKKDGFARIFRKELEAYCTDESTWPELSIENFKTWFILSCLDAVEDMVEDELLVDDKYDDRDISTGRN